MVEANFWDDYPWKIKEIDEDYLKITGVPELSDKNYTGQDDRYLLIGEIK